MRRYARYLMVCVVAGLLMAGCGASSSKSADTAGNMYQETVTETMAGAAAAPALGAMPDVSEEMGVSEHENSQEEDKRDRYKRKSEIDQDSGYVSGNQAV